MERRKHVAGWAARRPSPAIRTDAKARLCLIDRSWGWWRWLLGWDLPVGFWPAFNAGGAPMCRRKGTSASSISALGQSAAGVPFGRSSKSRKEVHEAAVPSYRPHSFGAGEVGKLHVRVVGAIRPPDEDGIVYGFEHGEVVQTVSDPDRG